MELLIFLSFALRISFTLQTASLATGDEVLDTKLDQLWKVFSVMDPVNYRLRHVLSASLAWMLLLPQLFVASLWRNTALNQLVKLVLSAMVLLVTSVSLSLERPPETAWADRGSCNHQAMSVPLIAMIFFFLVTTIIKIIMETRARKYLIRLRIFGAILEELSCGGSRRVQHLLLAVLLALALTSGNKLAFQQTFSGLEDEMGEFVVESFLGKTEAESEGEEWRKAG